MSSRNQERTGFGSLARWAQRALRRRLAASCMVYRSLAPLILLVLLAAPRPIAAQYQVVWSADIFTGGMPFLAFERGAGDSLFVVRHQNGPLFRLDDWRHSPARTPALWQANEPNWTLQTRSDGTLVIGRQETSGAWFLHVLNRDGSVSAPPVNAELGDAQWNARRLPGDENFVIAGSGVQIASVDLGTRRVVARADLTNFGAARIAISPDSNYVYVVSYSETNRHRLLRTADLTFVRQMDAHLLGPCVFLPSGRYVMTARTGHYGGLPKQLTKVDVQTGISVSWPSSIYTNKLDLHPDGKHLILGGKNGLEMWDVGGTPTLLWYQPLAQEVYDIEFSPDGNFFAFSQTGRVTVARWDVPGTPLPTMSLAVLPEELEVGGPISFTVNLGPDVHGPVRVRAADNALQSVAPFEMTLQDQGNGRWTGALDRATFLGYAFSTPITFVASAHFAGRTIERTCTVPLAGLVKPALALAFSPSESSRMASGQSKTLTLVAQNPSTTASAAVKLKLHHGTQLDILSQESLGAPGHWNYNALSQDLTYEGVLGPAQSARTRLIVRTFAGQGTQIGLHADVEAPGFEPAHAELRLFVEDPNIPNGVSLDTSESLGMFQCDFVSVSPEQDGVAVGIQPYVTLGWDPLRNTNRAPFWTQVGFIGRSLAGNPTASAYSRWLADKGLISPSKNPEYIARFHLTGEFVVMDCAFLIDAALFILLDGILSCLGMPDFDTYQAIVLDGETDRLFNLKRAASRFVPLPLWPWEWEHAMYWAAYDIFTMPGSERDLLLLLVSRVTGESFAFLKDAWARYLLMVPLAVSIGWRTGALLTFGAFVHVERALPRLTVSAIRR